MDITASNATFTLNIPGVFATPQQLVGFATDDAFTSEEVDVAETRLGVDGRLSAGFTPFLVPMRISLQGDSPSIPNVFELWAQAEFAAERKFFASASILLPSIFKQYLMSNGVLKRITPTVGVRRVLQPVVYRIDWENWDSQPYTSTLSALAQSLLGQLGI